MRTETKTITLYRFSELSTESQAKALDKLRDINTDYSWWESIYEDAANVGIKIESFDLDRNRHATGKFIHAADYTANKVISEHGEMCTTYKTAQNYLSEYSALVTKYSDGVKTDRVAEGNENPFDDEANELDEEFLKSIIEDYSIMLQKEYEYLYSDEAVKETIEANEYEFTEDGSRY